MRKRSRLHRWAIIFGALVAMTVLLRSIAGAQDSVDLALGLADKASYLLGETVSISGYADFGEAASSGASLSLIIYGPQPTTLPLPIAPGIHLYPEVNLEVSQLPVQHTAQHLAFDLRQQD